MREASDFRADGQARLSQIGAIIRKNRLGRYSVKELSQIAGVSAGLISQIERGFGNPSVMTLTRIAYALDLSIGSFFETGSTSPEDNFQVVTSTQRRRLLFPGHSLAYELLTPHLQGALGMVRTIVHSKFDNRSDPFSHVGMESVYLVAGRLGINVDGKERVLEEGDTVTFNCALPHAWFNDSDEPAEVIAAMSPPSF
jgi:transcriptional regulator with XRE-family HTH domain